MVLLDLCCCAGLAADGYMKAARDLGIDLHIVGIDIDPQPHYPYEFIQADAVEFLTRHGHEFDRIHASPPCQQYSHSTAQFRNKGKIYPDILASIRAGIDALGIPAVIENVPSAPIRPDVKFVGYVFDLPIIKKRFFELHHWFMMNPQMALTRKSVKRGDFATVVGKGHKNPVALCKVPGETIKQKWRAALGTDRVELTYREMAEGFPPAYTHYIGMEFLKDYFN